MGLNTEPNIGRVNINQSDFFLRGFLDGYELERERMERRKKENEEKWKLEKLVKMEVDKNMDKTRKNISS